MINTRIISAVMAAAVALSSAVGCKNSKKSTPRTEMREMTTQEIVRDMGVGINLGNTFEACGGWINGDTPQDYETAWGSPVITKEIIKGYADEGFGVLRVPVAWSNLMDEENNYTISPNYIKEVRQTVEWAIDSDMYVIMNIHWDGGWWDGFVTEKDSCMEKYTRIWEQLSGEFKAFDDRLMFESLNEEGGWEDIWNRYSGEGDKEASYGLLNEINQKFVDIVRASGGNNKNRHLLIAGYNTDVDLTCDELFLMPDDPADRCAVSVHYYTPSTFCILKEDADWGKAKTTWGSPGDYAILQKNMNMLKERFVDRGIPVIIGEYGAETSNKSEEDVNRFICAVCSEAYSRNMCPVLWDVTDVFYDRTECRMKSETLRDGLMSVKDEKKS